MNDLAVPRIIWQLWLQGWDKAPALVQASRQSWVRNNPGWEVRALDRAGLKDFLPPDVWARVDASTAPPEAFSDIVRLELLTRYGGVWADATTLCAQPLDEWIDRAAKPGFFALASPGGSRPLASWFLAAKQGDYIVATWRHAMEDYWRDRQTRDDYFWVHNLFGQLLERDPKFAALWDQAETISARHAFHFAPEAKRLKASAPADLARQLANPPAPVFKLTHKFRRSPKRGSLFETLVGWGLTGTIPARPWWSLRRWV
ncbi:MAG: capsular polysaccharide synthesis protein [Pseudooceanicola nanhaiensis]